MPKLKDEMVRCSQKRVNCFAYVNGKCDCLNDTKFKRMCPFYKDRQQVLVNGDRICKQ